MEINLKNYKDENISFTKNEINSIIGINENSKNSILNLVCEFQKKEDSKIENNVDENIEKTKSKSYVFWLKENYSNMLFNINIKEDIKFYLDNYNKEELEELLKIFELDSKILGKTYIELSSSEIRKILLIIGFLLPVKILIIENPTLNLDVKSRQILIKILKRQKREKTIILTSHNENFLLEVSDNVIVFDDDKLIKAGNKFEILRDEKLLNKTNLEVPNVVRFINKVKQLKNIKLGYRDNINDLIKDIYRYAK